MTPGSLASGHQLCRRDTVDSSAARLLCKATLADAAHTSCFFRANHRQHYGILLPLGCGAAKCYIKMHP